MISVISALFLCLRHSLLLHLPSRFRHIKRRHRDGFTDAAFFCLIYQPRGPGQWHSVFAPLHQIALPLKVLKTSSINTSRTLPRSFIASSKKPPHVDYCFCETLPVAHFHPRLFFRCSRVAAASPPLHTPSFTHPRAFPISLLRSPYMLAQVFQSATKFSTSQSPPFVMH